MNAVRRKEISRVLKRLNELVEDLSDILGDIENELPKMLWRITPGVNNGLPYHELLPLEKPSEGAFMNAYNLEYAHIPQSCKKIGEFAFANTKLAGSGSLRIASIILLPFQKDVRSSFTMKVGNTVWMLL